MALNAYLKLKGQKQGEIKGSVTQKGREGKIMVIGVMHEIVCPRDVVSGLPTGKRFHKPFLIKKELDCSSPLLLNMLVNNENIPQWELQFWQPSATGQERQHFTVELTNATISSIHLRSPNNRNPALARCAEQEEIAFTYQKIAWTWTATGASAEDDWEAPRT
jgi:type VI secretion system secreted protein Hcp